MNAELPAISCAQYTNLSYIRIVKLYDLSTIVFSESIISPRVIRWISIKCTCKLAHNNYVFNIDMYNSCDGSFCQ